MRHVWIDTDMGFDDLWAILALLRAPDIIVDGIGLVAGNAPLPIVADNASRAKAFFGWPQPLHAGCDRPLLQPPLTASYVLGDTGMQSVGHELPPAPLDLERENPNLIGGDNLSGSHHLDQNFLFRPVAGWSRYKTPVKSLFVCGAPTWPGAGTGAGSGFMLARMLAK